LGTRRAQASLTALRTFLRVNAANPEIAAKAQEEARGLIRDDKENIDVGCRLA
jgi:hypothetical protein